jgi:hypothetical protein
MGIILVHNRVQICNIQLFSDTGILYTAYIQTKNDFSTREF